MDSHINMLLRPWYPCSNREFMSPPDLDGATTPRGWGTGGTVDAAIVIITCTTVPSPRDRSRVWSASLPVLRRGGSGRCSRCLQRCGEKQYGPAGTWVIDYTRGTQDVVRQCRLRGGPQQRNQKQVATVSPLRSGLQVPEQCLVLHRR